jgi:outer membrane biosynthesis protein TonB
MTKLFPRLALAAIMTVAAAAAMAETIKLSDGSVIKGSILSSDDAGVRVLTPAGELALKKSDIVSITSDRYVVSLKDGSVLTGEITDISEAQLSLKTTAGTLALSRDTILSIVKEGAAPAVPAVAVSTPAASFPVLAPSTRTVEAVTLSTASVAVSSSAVTGLLASPTTAQQQIMPSPQVAPAQPAATPAPQQTETPPAPLAPPPPQQTAAPVQQQIPETQLSGTVQTPADKTEKTAQPAVPQPAHLESGTISSTQTESPETTLNLSQKRQPYPGQWEAALGYMPKSGSFGSGAWGELDYMVPAGKLHSIRFEAGAALGYTQADAALGSAESSISILPVEARLRGTHDLQNFSLFGELGAGYCLITPNANDSNVTEDSSGAPVFMLGAGVTKHIFQNISAGLGVYKRFISANITQTQYINGQKQPSDKISFSPAPLVFALSVVLDF